MCRLLSPSNKALMHTCSVLCPRQVAAAKGDLTAAIACIFDSEPSAPEPAPPPGPNYYNYRLMDRPVGTALRDAMQMADTVLKLMDEHEAPGLE